MATSARSSSSSARTATGSSSAVRDARLLAGPDEVAFVVDATVDTGNASQLARAAERAGATRSSTSSRAASSTSTSSSRRRRCAIRVVEVVPPHPPKLLEMARTVLDYDEDLPPLELDFVPIDLRELAAAHPADALPVPVPLRGLELDAPVDFLDAGPPEAADWTLVGCERSRQIHAALYGHEPHARVDFCPLLVDGEPGPEPTLLKCCLRERGIEREGARMTVPWGASLEEVRRALRSLAGVAA